MGDVAAREGTDPDPKRILVMGVYRSGTTRLYNIIREALLAAYGRALMTGHFSEAAELERHCGR